MIVDKIRKREIKDNRTENPVDIPAHKWIKCDKCKEIMYKDIVQDNFSICPNCGHHFRLSSRRRVAQIADKDTFKEFDLKIETVNPLNMQEYAKKMAGLREKTGIEEAVKCGTCAINGIDVVLCVMDGNFLMGSMGTVVGEKITYSVEKAIELKLPLIIFSVSGGARMQEGIMSLMQMGKTSASIAKLDSAGILFISVLTDPTYGGVTASFASLGDIILAEPRSNDWICGTSCYTADYTARTS